MTRLQWNAVFFATILMLCVGIVGGITYVARAQTPTPILPTPLPDGNKALAPASPEDALDRANQAIEYASRTTDQASLVLGFIQAFSILIGAVVTLAGFALTGAAVRRLRDFDNELEKLKQALSNEEEENKRLRERLQQEASERLEQARKESENSARALQLLQLGDSQFNNKNIKAALRAYQQAYDLDKRNQTANYRLGELYIMEDQLDQAVFHLNQALEVDAEFAPAMAALGYAKRLLGQRETDLGKQNKLFSEAEGMYIDALRSDEKVKDVNGQSINAALAALYKRQKRDEQAIIYYAKAEQVTPDSSYPVNNLAQLYFMLGDDQNARTYFERSLAFSQRGIAVNANDFWARFDLATAQIALELPDWRRGFESVLQSAPFNPLNTALYGLETLRKAPKPPKDVDEAIDMVKAEIARRKAKATS
jgi:tetratricopeptide (TPR) repeat protein